MTSSSWTCPRWTFSTPLQQSSRPGQFGRLKLKSSCDSLSWRNSSTLTKSYGRDLRHLTPRDNAPCLLHSYGHALDSCPCGCRGLFNPLRLLKDGLRGFFIWGAQLQDYRFLHPAEAALLCTVPPATTFPSPTRAGLCLVGQCAAPLQAVWILAHVQTFWNSPCFASPQMALGSYQTFLLRQAHGFFQTTSNKFHITLQDDSEWKLIQSTL